MSSLCRVAIVLACLATLGDGAPALDEDVTVILVQGALGPDDILYFNNSNQAAAKPEEYVSLATLYQHHAWANISYIQIYGEGEGQRTTARVASGGVGSSGAAIVLQSGLGMAIDTITLIYGLNGTDVDTTTTVTTDTQYEDQL